MAYRIVPSGTKLTTYYPDRPGQGDNISGFLIEGSGTKGSKRLCVMFACDAQEQAASSVLQYSVRHLLSGSALSRRLLGSLSFLILPFNAEQAVRDGLSRYGEDCQLPGEDPNGTANSGLNGVSEVGNQIATEAVLNWIFDPADPHPDPSKAGFAEFALHCSNPQMVLASATRDTSPTPVTPYAFLTFPDAATPAEGVATFREGFDPVIGKQFWSPGADNIAPGGWTATAGLNLYGGTSFYFELPWRAPGHNAAHWWDEDDHDTVALALLSGIAAAASAAIPLDPSAVDCGGAAASVLKKHTSSISSVAATASVASSARKVARLPSAMAASVAVSASEATTRLVSVAVVAGSGVGTVFAPWAIPLGGSAVAAGVDVGSAWVRRARLVSAVGASGGAATTVVHNSAGRTLRSYVGGRAGVASAVATNRQFPGNVAALARVSVGKLRVVGDVVEVPALWALVRVGEATMTITARLITLDSTLRSATAAVAGRGVEARIRRTA